MVIRIIFLIGQFLLALVKLLPASKPESPKEPSTVPPVDEPGRALDRARKRAHAKKDLPN